MESLRQLYRVGRGPSSSHTMGPAAAASREKAAHPDARRFYVTLYGSLAKTGKGHLTDVAIRDALYPVPVEIRFDRETPEAALPHPNTMDFRACTDSGETTARYMSVGGGKVVREGEPDTPAEHVYAERSFSEIRDVCVRDGLRLWEYVERTEGAGIWDFLSEVWEAMLEEIRVGVSASGELAGGLHVQRKARTLFRQHHMDETPQTRENRLVCAYAYAASEQNAGGGVIVTAPTCGSCGVLPAVLAYEQEVRGFPDEAILHALASAGIIGNLVKTNASISGAECGCQAEVGTACCMAAAALAELYRMELDQIEYAAEISMEHHLGLTCDPIAGLVQIPCIERNAVAAVRAMNACNLSYFLTGSRNISYDMVCRAMRETGVNLDHRFRETSEGGLAKLYNRRKKL